LRAKHFCFFQFDNLALRFRINLMAELLTLQQLWERAGNPFQPKHFVQGPEPCGNPNLYFPYPTVPRYLMTPENAAKAQAALDVCTRIVGTWGKENLRWAILNFKPRQRNFLKPTMAVSTLFKFLMKPVRGFWQECRKEVTTHSS
jgi:hypothetical protein